MELDRGIGKNNQVPWHVSSDLKRFKKLTMGHHIIMGRKTYESISRQLPGRKMLILSNNPEYEVDGALVFNSLEDAIGFAEDNGESEVFVIGGGEIFEQSMLFADRMYLTIIDASIDSDVYFPPYHDDEWNVVHCESVDLRNGDQYSYKYKILERVYSKYL
jgi:dihydrofolate reductase